MKIFILLFLVSCTTLKPLVSKDIELNTLERDVQEKFEVKEVPVVSVKPKKITKKEVKEENKTIDTSSVKEKIFKPITGESFTYSVYAPMGIKAGTLITTVVGTKMIGNKEVVHIKANLYNTSFFASIFKVNLLVESFIDPFDFKSERYQIVGQEGSIFKENVELYDYMNKKRIVVKKQGNQKDTKVKNNEYPLEYSKIQDVLSSFYYVKEHDFNNKNILNFVIIADRRVKQAKAQKLRNETLNGIDCSVLGVAFEEKQKLEDNLIWIDKNKKIHKVVSAMNWGTFKIVLEK